MPLSTLKYAESFACSGFTVSGAVERRSEKLSLSFGSVGIGREAKCSMT